MEIFGGLMVMMSILSLFMAVVWLIMPFVVFTIKGKLDRTIDMLEDVEKRLLSIETRLQNLPSPPPSAAIPTEQPHPDPAEPEI